MEALRTRLHEMWASVAPGWAAHAEFIDARSRPLTDRMLELTDPRPGERVLELACGPGTVGIAASPRVGDGGEVLVSDVAPEMTAIAAERAAERGLENVSARDLDLEAIDLPDGSFDVVLCREGLMLVPDPARAAREIHRVLGPGGRTAIAVWGPRERNPWLGVVFDTVSEQLGAPVPPPGIPGPFSLEDAGAFEAVLSGAGLCGVSVDEVAVPLRAATFDEWWSRTSTLAGPLAKILAGLPADAGQALRARLQTAVRPFETAAGLEFPGVALVASGRR